MELQIHADWNACFRRIHYKGHRHLNSRIRGNDDDLSGSTVLVWIMKVEFRKDRNPQVRSSQSCRIFGDG